MAFPPQFLDEIRARAPLAEVVGRRVKLTRRGREHSGLCPFHKEKTPSFTVSEDKGFFHCFGCGAHGDVIGFVMQSDGLSFPEAVTRLAGECGLTMPERTPEAAERAERQAGLYDVVEAAAGMFRVMNVNMSSAIREISIERGHDPREFLLICAGGAGAIHAAMPRPVRRRYVLPPALFAVADYDLRNYLLALMALAAPDLSCMATANPSTRPRPMSPRRSRPLRRIRRCSQPRRGLRCAKVMLPGH